ncbi:Lrp/AsnC family transcriptional regulator [Candidatus Woesearchaeota archaeon]|nr:Lrp/AsnC family transcriptional regulator [Candidatus Woesearchaeota archaeon]
MKKTDMLLTVNLRKNARASLTDISRETKIPISTLYEKLKSKNGTFFKKFTTILDFSSLGFMTRITVVLKTFPEKRDEMLRYLTNHPNVNNVYRINNGYDFQFEAIFKDLKQQEDFMEEFEDSFPLRKKEIFYVINDVKREGFLEDYSLILG